jgi:hypothetical protein
MSFSPTVHDVSVAPSRSCNCCDNVTCCIPFFGRRISRPNTQPDIRIIRTADEAIQKKEDSPAAGPSPAVPVVAPEAPRLKPSLPNLDLTVLEGRKI